MPSSAETDAGTFVEKTISESGNEAFQAQEKKSLEVAVGSKLGPYLLVRKLGQGSMGSVYEARHTKLDKTLRRAVAVESILENRIGNANRR